MGSMVLCLGVSLSDWGSFVYIAGSNTDLFPAHVGLWHGCPDENQHLHVQGHGSRLEKGGFCPLWVGGEVLPLVEQFKYLGILFMSEGKMEIEIGRQTGVASTVVVVCVPDRCGKERA